jgi:hypothetical protein
MTRISIVYDPRKGDNEAESAALFGQFASEVALVYFFFFSFFFLVLIIV